MQTLYVLSTHQETFSPSVTMKKILNFGARVRCYKDVKGKAVPLQAWSGPEGSKKLRFPDFMTKAQYGGKVVSLTHRPPLSAGTAPGTHFCSRLSRP